MIGIELSAHMPPMFFYCGDFFTQLAVEFGTHMLRN